MLRIICLLLLTISSGVLTQQKQCPKYCEDCDFTLTCHSCLKTKFVKGKCEPTTDLKGCLVLGENFSCQIYQPGYSSIVRSGLEDSKLGQFSSQCVPNTIPNCQVSIQITNLDQKLSQRRKNQYCIACKNGYPVPGNTRCGGFKDRNEVHLEQKVNRCIWGGRDYQDSSTYCYQCQEGYSVDENTGECVATSLVGCLIQSDGKQCILCNAFAGYYKKTPSKCTK